MNIKIALIITFALFQATCLPVYSQKQKLKFQHLNIDDGLSHNNVICIHQDRKGFMWFGTRDGLCKYDGYQYTVYKNNPSDKSSISHNMVTNIIEDADGNLWIGTWGGLNHFDQKKRNFHALRSQAF